MKELSDAVLIYNIVKIERNWCKIFEILGQNSVGGTGSGQIAGRAVGWGDRQNFCCLGGPPVTQGKKPCLYHEWCIFCKICRKSNSLLILSPWYHALLLSIWEIFRIVFISLGVPNFWSYFIHFMNWINCFTFCRHCCGAVSNTRHTKN